MIWLLRDLDLLSVLLRAASFSLEAMALGGLLFLLFVARPAAQYAQARRPVARAVRWFACGLLLAQACATGLSLAVLHQTAQIPFASLLSAGFVEAGIAEASGCLLLTLALSSKKPRAFAVAVLGGVCIVGAAVAQSHSASRLDYRTVLMLLTLLHHLGAAGWVGAMFALWLAMRRMSDARALALRYSWLAVASVTALVGAGICMSYAFVGSWSGFVGSSYGILVLAKIYLTLAMLVLGFANYRVLRGAPVSLLQLRRFSEVEVGLGLTALLAAASLTSQPPAADLGGQLVPPSHVAARLRWEPPRLHSPSAAQLAPATSMQTAVEVSQYSAGSTSDAMDRAWSEYNHHWAGLIVLACSVLSLLAAVLPPGILRRTAGQWPLLFIALAVFIVLRADPENWPLGPRSFWESFASPDVLEHRLYAVLITLFALFQWAVETGRLRTRWAAYIFPLLCALGGAALLTHTHGDADIEQETLAELSHGGIAVLGATAGWARWIELRAPDSRATRIAAKLWPVCLMLVGLLLLDYRES